MDIFNEVKHVLVACETPRDFLLATFGEDWRHAPIACYRMRPDGSGCRCYIAVLTIRCPDCGEPAPAMAVFTKGEQGGYCLLHPEQMEMVL